MNDVGVRRQITEDLVLILELNTSLERSGTQTIAAVESKIQRIYWQLAIQQRLFKMCICVQKVQKRTTVPFPQLYLGFFNCQTCLIYHSIFLLPLNKVSTVLHFCRQMSGRRDKQTILNTLATVGSME